MEIVRVVRMPSCHSQGVTILDCDGNYNVYINDELSPEGKLRAYEHEKRHILCGHFYDGERVVLNEIEAES